MEVKPSAATTVSPARPFLVNEKALSALTSAVWGGHHQAVEHRRHLASAELRGSATKEILQ